MSVSDLFKRLGAPLNSVYDWAAESADGKRAVFTLWSDEIKFDRETKRYTYVIFPTKDRRPRDESVSYDWDGRARAIHMCEIALRAIQSSAECLGVLIYAKDAHTLGARTRENFEKGTVRTLVPARDGERIVATITGRLPIVEVTARKPSQLEHSPG